MRKVAVVKAYPLPGRANMSIPGSLNLGVTGFEPATCRRGDRTFPVLFYFSDSFLIQLVPPPPSLVVSLPANCFRTRFKFFDIRHHPGDTMSRRLAFSAVVSPHTLLQISTRPNISTTLPPASQYVGVKHIPRISRGDRIRTCDLSPRRPHLSRFCSIFQTPFSSSSSRPLPVL